MKKILAAALVGTLVATLAATTPLAAKPARKAVRPSPAAWDARVAPTAAGAHLIGNPAAKVKLVEFISYTCPHCADFAAESKGPLFAGPIKGGTLSVEVRPFFRNIIDIPATLLAQCGPSSRFLGNHGAILAAQSTWLKAPSDDLQKSWPSLNFAQRMKALSQDLGLYQLMQGRGYTPAQLDACLADQPLADKLAKQTEDAVTTIGVKGTPSFLINGKLQEVYAWPQLKPLLDEALR